MTDTLRALLEQWSASPELVVLAGFLVAFLEALAIVGLLVPGILLLLAIAALIGWDPAWMLALTAALALGAMAGDGISYWIGRRYRGRLAMLPVTTRRGRWLENGRALFRRHGGRSVFIARFVGPARPMVPLVAGSLNMPVRDFVLRMTVACWLWAPAMVIPGALFGESLELAAEFGGRLVVLIVLLVVGAWVLVAGVRAVYGWASWRSTWWLKRLGNWLRRHPRFGRLAGPLLVPGQREVVPVLGLALVLLISFAVFLTVLTLAVINAPQALSAAGATATLAGSLRTPLADPLFVVLGLAGSAPAALALAVGMALFLLAARRRVALVHWGLAVGIGTLLAMALDGVLGWLPIRVAGPDVPFATLTLMHGFAAVIAAKDLPAVRRKWLYLAASGALLLTGFARLYLGLAGLYALGVSVALSVTWLTLVGIAYRVRARPARRHAAWRLVVAFALLGAVGAVSANVLGFADLLRVQQSTPPAVAVDAQQWWATGQREDGTRLPARRTVFGNAERKRFDAQVAVPQATFEATLDAAGWTPLPEIDEDAVRAVFSGRGAGERLPHLPRDFNGRTQELKRRLALDDERWAVLRAWRSGWQLTPDERPVWLVQVRVVRPKSYLGLFTLWRRDPQAGTLGIDRLRAGADEWRWQRDPEIPVWRADAAWEMDGETALQPIR